MLKDVGWYQESIQSKTSEDIRRFVKLQQFLPLALIHTGDILCCVMPVSLQTQ